MQILRNPVKTEPCVLVLGMFDGVHRGHQALLQQGRLLADKHRLPLHVCTFEPHPLAVIRPELTPPRLTTQTERARWMHMYHVDRLCVNSFTKAFAAIAPADFVRKMVETYQPRFVVAGFNFTFGDRGAGNADTLRSMQEALGYETVTVPAVVLEGDTVSSSRIRQRLAAGDLGQALRLLGHGYTMCGKVIHGKHIGRTMGFPTANIAVKAAKAMPAYGVYACRMTIRGDQQAHHAVVNVGRHPTLPEGLLTVEAHVLDETMTLYGLEARLEFLQYLRPERTFAGVDELSEQIAQDADNARRFFAGFDE